MLTEYERQVEAHYGEIQTAFYEGQAEGQRKQAKATAHWLILRGMNDEEISEATGLTLLEINRLREDTLSQS